MDRIDCLGVGSPIVDTLARVSDIFISTTGATRGSMTFVDSARMAGVIAAIEGHLVQAPGGSAGNTVVALARLGSRSALLGKTGSDTTGRFYRESLIQSGASDSRIKTGGGASARCLSLITPDAQRTMMTDLGAAATLCGADMGPEDFSGVRMVYIEGYLMYNRPAIDAVLQLARGAGAKIGLDLGAFTLVQAMRDDILSILREYVDIVVANEDEARALFGELPQEEQARRLGRLCDVAVVNLGARGSLICADGRLLRIPARKVERVVDTTGAG
ncbi:MAG: adenosine kinase, partial [Opitutales bacterium]